MKSRIGTVMGLRALFLLLLLVPVAVGGRLPSGPGLTSDSASSQAEPLTAVETGASSVEESEAASSSGLLDESELAELNALDEEPGDELIGGALSNQHLTYIAIALGAAVIVLIAK